MGDRWSKTGDRWLKQVVGGPKQAKTGGWGWRWVVGGGNRVIVGSWWPKTAALLSYVVGNTPQMRGGAIVVIVFVFVVHP